MFGRTNVIKIVGKHPLFEYVGDGSDGDIVVASGETYVIDVIECAESAVLNCKSLTIEAGGTLTVSHPCLGLFLKVQNDCVINGTINMDKKSPHLVCVNEDDLAANPCITLLGSPVGGNGGAGGGACYYTYSGGGDKAMNLANGGAGGASTVFGGGLGGGGGGATGAGGAGNRPPVGTQWPYPGTTGAGAYGAGGGSTANSACNGGASPGGSGGVSYLGSSKAGRAGDAYGGGAIYIYVGGNLTMGSSSRLTACGGNGAATGDYLYQGYRCPGAGGGGGGGLVRMVYGKSYTNNGVTIAVNGGSGGKGTTVSSAVSSTLLNRSTGKNGTTGDSKVYTFDELLPK